MPARKRHSSSIGHSLPMLRLLGSVYLLLTVPTSIAMYSTSPSFTLSLLMHLTMIACTTPFFSYLIAQRHDVLSLMRRTQASDDYRVDLEGKLIEPYTYAQMDISAIPTLFSAIFIGVFLMTPYSEFFRMVSVWSMGIAGVYHLAVHVRQRMRPKRKSVRLKHARPTVAHLIEHDTEEGMLANDEQHNDIRIHHRRLSQ